MRPKSSCVKKKKMSDKVKIGLVAAIVAVYFAITYWPKNLTQVEATFEPDDIDSFVYWWDGKDRYWSGGVDTVLIDSNEIKQILSECEYKTVRVVLTPKRFKD